MAAPRIFIGAEFFRKLRENGFYYADKTGIIEELLLQNPAEVTLLTRPRRFGKTLTMTMLQEFFDIEKDSRGIFEGLAVSKNRELCEKWMNKYPVVFLTLKGVEGLNFERAMIKMKILMAGVLRDFTFLTESPRVNAADRKKLTALEYEETDSLADSLILLIRALHDHYGKNVVLLIDEYDVPLAKAQENGYYREMVDFIRAFLGDALKTTPFLQLAVLTGCLRLSKESIFTGLNNFACYTISDNEFVDKIGFTNADIDNLLEAAGFAEKKASLREWYDGYRFGKEVEMYCPWDVLQYVAALGRDASAEPRAYWNNSSGNGVIKGFAARADLNIRDKFETLLAGGCVEARITENLTYDSLHSSEDNLWTLLYLTGYLTKARPEQMEACGILPGGEMTPLVIPNKEIRAIFKSSVAELFRENVAKSDRTELFSAFWAGDDKALTKILRKELYLTISYYDAHEDFYHAFLTGMLSMSGYEVRSNRESGNGRPDILVLDVRNESAAIIEVKRASSLQELTSSAQKALLQIEREKYAEGLPPFFEHVVKYGVAFCQKECLVLKG